MQPSDLDPGPAAPATVSIEAALAKADWPDLTRRLTRYAHSRLALLRKSACSWETAEEIAQEAILRVLDPAYASWDRERHPDLFDCLGHVTNGLVANHVKRRAQRAKHVSLREDEGTHDDELPQVERVLESDEKVKPPPRTAVLLTDDRTAETALTGGHPHDDRAEVAIAALREQLATDRPCLKLLELIQNRVWDTNAQARALRVSVRELHAVKKRLMARTRAVARDLGHGGDES